MRKLMKYLKGYTKESIIGPLFKMLEASFELIVPLIMANIIDVGIKNEDQTYIIKCAVILVILGVLGLVCSMTAQFFAAKAALGFGTALRKNMFAHVNSLSYAELDTIGTSTLVTRITSDINQTQAGVNLVLRLFLRSPFIVIGALIMAFTINVKITVIFLITIPLLALIIYGIMLATIPIYKKVQSQLDEVSKSTRENLVGVRVIRAFSRQESEIAHFEDTSKGLMDTQLLAGKISALLNPLTYVLVNLAMIAIIWYGGGQVNEGIISQGDVIALVNYMSQILLALVALSNLIVTFTKASASATRINEVFDYKSSMEEIETTNKIGKKTGVKVEFDEVSFAYQSAATDSLTNINLRVGKGQTIGIIGGTGSGKSTLVNLIPRFYDVTKGTIKMDGIPIKEYPLLQLRSKIGVVPQKSILFKGTIRENMKWGKKDATDEEIYRALDIAQAREIVATKQDGLDAMIMQGGTNFSGGQRQRLTIARALVGNPEILILDDSASALDFATDAALRRAIASKTRDMTVFIVSQRATTIKGADQIIVLDDGCIAGIGTHEELIQMCEVYREICLSQLSSEEVHR